MMKSHKCTKHKMEIRVIQTGGCNCDPGMRCYCAYPDVNIVRECRHCGVTESIPGLTDRYSIERWFEEYFAEKP